jgi:hypothetical protein
MESSSVGVTLARFSSAFLLMISRLCACWLVVLVLSPFTAPFATCDLGQPIRSTGRGGPAIAAARTDTSTALVTSRVKTGRQKLVSNAGRVEQIAPPSSIDLTLTHAIPSIQKHDALRTVLRL